MKNIATFIFLICCVNAFAQTPTNSHGTRLGSKPYSQKQHLIFMNDKGKILLLFSWIDFKIKDISPESVDMNKTSFSVQMDTKDSIQFKANTEYSVAVTTNQGDVLNIACDVTAQQLKVLTEHRLENIRVNLNGGVIFDSVAITESNQKDVAKQAGIVLNEL